MVRVVERFCIPMAEFHPYWRNDNHVTVDSVCVWGCGRGMALVEVVGHELAS